MLHFSKSVSMKKQTPLHQMAWGWVHFHFFVYFSFNGGSFYPAAHVCSVSIPLRGCELVLLWLSSYSRTLSLIYWHALKNIPFVQYHHIQWFMIAFSQSVITVQKMQWYHIFTQCSSALLCALMWSRLKTGVHLKLAFSLTSSLKECKTIFIPYLSNMWWHTPHKAKWYAVSYIELSQIHVCIGAQCYQISSSQALRHIWQTWLRLHHPLPISNLRY